MKLQQEIYNRGLELLDKVHGGHTGEAIVNGLNEVCPDFATAIIQFGFGEVLSREGLDLKTRQLSLISACVALGNPMPQLQANIEAALNVGATQQEVIEVIFQAALYAGFAYATNALFIAKELFAKKY